MSAEPSPRHSVDELLAVVESRAAAARHRRKLVVLGAGAATLLVFASGVAVAGNGGGGSSEPVVHVANAAAPPPAAIEETTTSTEATTTTTAPPPLAPPTTAPVGVVHPTPTTIAARPKAPAPIVPPVAARNVAPVAVVHEVAPPSRDAARVYVSTRGSDVDSYVTRMSLNWGDGSAVTTFDYPMSSCQDHASTQAADANHRYAVPGMYTVQLIVTSVSCDGKDAQTSSAETVVQSPPSG